MKIRKLLFNAFLAIGSVLMVSCSETISQVEETLATADEEKSSEIALAPGDSCTFSGSLTDAEVAGLMEMREEEKLAHDVYSSFFETYNYVIFDNISKSESAHTSAVLYLMSGYGLEDPATDEAGVFSNPMFSELFASLTEDGSAGLVEALKVGAFIEEFDINDLQNHLEETQNEDVIRVYSNLLRGSKNHLKAFTFALSRQGETYTPTVITEEEYHKILDDSNTSEWTPGYYYYNSNDSTTCDGTGPNF
ncbi:DUF2202 domain-containing protein [Maribellus maritimus]|uniref:DUF2202 domain-containing protein n=1 Tax=Maribellus maritimus TaxID=2870838 RepID=UPI001EECA96D|nr:DUF2202 domain-containing protein [Maribellus maritimus]MCG6188211.1 DUF2202 domain-containing protein [Maribellus maritimus]